MFLRGKPLLISLLLHLLVGALYGTLMPLGMNGYGHHVGFSSHGDIGLGLAQYYAYVLFIGAQPMIAVARPLAAKLLILAIPLAIAAWMLQDHPLRMLYFSLGPGLLVLAAISTAARLSAHAAIRTNSREPTDA
ncbi:hypothetical protein [Stenotrophomonas sp.]|uniref:hypothetical protein n=1 Tax=Stenotrophomonas sp. TaxID=69392 RepID=UPI002D674F48|nr:hypothetical protein [Stenotrophomonas sp.]HYQ24231.1 hypothetical protein [Stenotrophomonas sp.]